MSAVLISAVQSVKIFGFCRQPVLTLSWTDIKQHNLTWRQLHAIGLDAELLKRVQPDKSEWIQRGGIQVSDLIDMSCFPVNPLTDFGFDLAELWSMRCSPAQMAAMGITFDNLLAKGITPQIMSAFAFTLSDWTELRFAAWHAEKMGEDDSQRVFALSKGEPARLRAEQGRAARRRRAPRTRASSRRAPPA
jgi:hypothetical protein